jgi:DNA-3-methyladenine glycosylase
VIGLTQALPQSFFFRPAEIVAPELIGCLLVKLQDGGELLWGLLVETVAYCQGEPACTQLILLLLLNF